jgi:uncharacterized membrane protein
MAMRRGRSELWNLSSILALAALGCVLLYGLRVVISGRIWYLYLVLNLAIAFVPYIIAAAGTVLLAATPSKRLRAFIVAPVALLWLLFYPNAPYILTDFIHVVERTYLKAPPSDSLGLNAILWYDLIMNAAFAFMGHFIGLVSMWLMQRNLKSSWGRTAAIATILAAALLAGFGIYLGRFLRLNSWDLLLDPRRVIAEIGEAVQDPLVFLFSAVFSLFIFLTYAALVMFKRMSPSED